jgi:hypothetical protein
VTTAGRPAAVEGGRPAALAAAAATAIHCLALGGFGCRAAGPLAAPVVEFLEVQPASGRVLGADLHPVHSARLVYQVTEGPDAGSRVVVRRVAGGPLCATWTDGPSDESRHEIYRIGTGGEVFLEAVVEGADSAISLFEPALRVAPAELAPGQVLRQQVAMRVVEEGDPARPRETGTAAQTLEYSGDQRLRIGSAGVLAQRVVATFEAKLRLAEARTVTTTWIVPGLGPVVRRTEQTVRSLGIPIRRRTSTIALAEPMVAEPQPQSPRPR